MAPTAWCETDAVLRVARAANAPFETLAVPAAYWGAPSPADPVGIFCRAGQALNLMAHTFP